MSNSFDQGVSTLSIESVQSSSVEFGPVISFQGQPSPLLGTITIPLPSETDALCSILFSVPVSLAVSLLSFVILRTVRDYNRIGSFSAQT